MVPVFLSGIIDTNMEKKKMERQSFIPKDLKLMIWKFLEIR